MSGTPQHPVESTTYDNSVDALSDRIAAHTAPIDDIDFLPIGF